MKHSAIFCIEVLFLFCIISIDSFAQLAQFVNSDKILILKDYLPKRDDSSKLIAKERKVQLKKSDALKYLDSLDKKAEAKARSEAEEKTRKEAEARAKAETEARMERKKVNYQFSIDTIVFFRDGKKEIHIDTLKDKFSIMRKNLGKAQLMATQEVLKLTNNAFEEEKRKKVLREKELSLERASRLILQNENILKEKEKKQLKDELQITEKTKSLQKKKLELQEIRSKLQIKEIKRQIFIKNIFFIGSIVFIIMLIIIAMVLNRISSL